MITVTTFVGDVSIDLLVRREEPARTWPDGKWSYWERFSFPLRCKTRVLELAAEIEKLSPGEAADMVRERRRAIQWQ